MMSTRFIWRSLLSSLSLRWSLAIAGIITLALTLLIAFIYNGIQQQMQEERVYITQLARQKISQRMDSEIALVHHRLAKMFESVELSLEAVVSQRSVRNALTSRNDVIIAEDIGARVLRAGFSGVMILDRKGNVIGSDRTGVELVSASRAYATHPIRQQIEGALKRLELNKPTLLRQIGAIDKGISQMFLAPLEGKYAFVLAMAVLDEFSDPIGVILAHRVLKPQEQIFEDFAAITKSSVALMHRDQVISTAGIAPARLEGLTPDVDTLPATQAGLIEFTREPLLARCGASYSDLSICVVYPTVEVTRFRDEITQIGDEYAAGMNRTMALAGLATLLLVSGAAFWLSRRMTRPLMQLSKAVTEVARGEWQVVVPHVRRLDEIGRIARSVSSMQSALAERERMKQEMIRIDVINQRRLHLDGVVTKFESGLSNVMRDMGETVGVLARSNQMMERAARQAESYAEQIRSTSLATASNTSLVGRATLELSNAIRDVGRRVKATSGAFSETEAQTQGVEAKLSEITAAAGEVEAGLSLMQDAIADIGKIGLGTSLEAAQSAHPGRVAPLAISISGLAQNAGQAANSILQHMALLVQKAEEANLAMGGVKGVLGRAYREVSAISVAVEEQNATAREIFEGLANASMALSALAEAVDSLRENMSEAHGASTEFFNTTHRMAEDAKAIDRSLRIFVREAVA